jgi:3-oxoacyl-[acyl-carrier protein] reductase
MMKLPLRLPVCRLKAGDDEDEEDKLWVNTIAPGNIFFSGGSCERHFTNRREAVEDMLATEVPLHRFGTPQEIAALAALLCSSRSAFTTGSTFVADGGQTRPL